MFDDVLKEIGHVVITDRDVELFQFLNEQKCMVASQIYETFWPESDVTSGTARQRLTKLVNAGYVKTQEFQSDKVKKLKLFLLAQKGIDVLKGKGMDHEFGEIGKVNEYAIGHSLKLGTIRSVFRAMGQTNWRSERVIRKEDYKREFYPDAILDINGLKIAIELENSFREKEKYITRFAKYSKMSEFTLVLYVLSWPMIKSWLLDIEVPQDRLCFLLYDNLMNKKREAELVNQTSRIPLKSIVG